MATNNRSWINAKDKLPDDRHDVIVYTFTDEIEIGNYIGNGKWITSSYGDVVCWMPLPELPSSIVTRSKRRNRKPQITAGDEFIQDSEKELKHSFYQ